MAGEKGGGQGSVRVPAAHDGTGQRAWPNADSINGYRESEARHIDPSAAQERRELVQAYGMNQGIGVAVHLSPAGFVALKDPGDA